MELEVVNVHGPFQDRMVLWDNLITISFMKEKNIIFGGDLNFSLGISELWGPHLHLDSE